MLKLVQNDKMYYYTLTNGTKCTIIINERRATMYGKRMCELRQQQGLSQKEIGIKVGEKLGTPPLAPNTIGKYEAEMREPSNDTLIALSQIFGVSVDYLLGVTDLENNAIVDDIIRTVKTLSADSLRSLLKILKYLKWQEDHQEEEH